MTGLLADGHLVEARVRSGRSFVTADALRSEREIMSRMLAITQKRAYSLL